jgi:hypothetical protein
MFYELWFWFAVISLVFGTISAIFYVKQKNEIKAQMIGTLGCMGCIMLFINSISLISGLLSIITFLLKLFHKST